MSGADCPFELPVYSSAVYGDGIPKGSCVVFDARDRKIIGPISDARGLYFKAALNGHDPLRATLAQAVLAMEDALGGLEGAHKALATAQQVLHETTQDSRFDNAKHIVEAHKVGAHATMKRVKSALAAYRVKGAGA